MWSGKTVLFIQRTTRSIAAVILMAMPWGNGAGAQSGPTPPWNRARDAQAMPEPEGVISGNGIHLLHWCDTDPADCWEYLEHIAHPYVPEYCNWVGALLLRFVDEYADNMDPSMLAQTTAHDLATKAIIARGTCVKPDRLSK
jgi:hypothetical protein